MYDWLMTLKHPDGKFSMNQNGEADIRGTYCAIFMAYVLDILTPELTHNCAKYIKRYFRIYNFLM